MRRTIASTAFASALVVASAWLSAPARAEAPPAPAPTPWASGAEPVVPSFLDTSDKRIKDDRPPPSAEQVAGLRELQSELERMRRMSSAYRDTLDALLRRDYQRQRADREEQFTSEITFEEEQEDRARLDAIARFERFIAKYPSDPTYTPDAMFRLGELYFERDAIAQQVEMNAYLSERDRRLATGEQLEGLVEPQKSFAATTELYQRLVAAFP